MRDHDQAAGPLGGRPAVRSTGIAVRFQPSEPDHYARFRIQQLQTGIQCRRSDLDQL